MTTKLTVAPWKWENGYVKERCKWKWENEKFFSFFFSGVWMDKGSGK